jgi:hypothetical protein
MDQADSNISISASVDSTRRGFLSKAAGVAVGATAAVVATKAIALPADDGDLLKLEDLIFEQHEKATAYDDEIFRLQEIWTAKAKWLHVEALIGRCTRTTKEQWALVGEMPESIEHKRLCNSQAALPGNGQAGQADVCDASAHGRRPPRQGAGLAWLHDGR